MVNASRSQSALAPSRCNWPMIVPRDLTFCSQTRDRNLSRPMSRREGSPFLAISRSVTICVAIPAWSVPGCQRVSSPFIRCQRTRISCSVLLKAWPMCKLPVTFGGGIITEKAGCPGLALAPAAKALASSQSFEIRASASAGVKFFSMGIAGILLSWTCFSGSREKGQALGTAELRSAGSILKGASHGSTRPLIFILAHILPPEASTAGSGRYGSRPCWHRRRRAGAQCPPRWLLWVGLDRPVQPGGEVNQAFRRFHPGQRADLIQHRIQHLGVRGRDLQQKVEAA